MSPPKPSIRTIAPLLLALAVCLGSILSPGQPDATAHAAGGPPPPISPPVDARFEDPRFDRFILQPGTAFHILLQTPIDTGVNQPDDTLEAVLTQNLYLGERLILSKNTRFEGRIIQLEPPIQGRDAILGLKFTDILLDNADKLPIQAHIKTERPDHTWGGALTEGTKPRYVTHRVFGIGEYNQIVMSGPRAVGKNIQFQPGERWTIILETPLTILKPRE